MTINKLVVEKDKAEVIELTGDELTEYNNRIKLLEDEQAKADADKEAKDALKASAKAKLIAGEALTEDEANTIVL